MAVPILELSNVHKAYGPKKILEGIDLTIESGNFYALLGRNGTGKSTLMRLLMRNESFDSGAGTAFGVDMESDTPDLNKLMGFVSEQIQYILYLNIGQILEFHKSIRPEWNEDYVRTSLEILGLDHLKSYLELSRGQRMQLALITARAFNPRLILLDEITSVLDVVARKYFLDDLAKYVSSGGTVILATNIVSEVQFIANRVILLAEGKVKLNSRSSDLTKNFIKIFQTPDMHLEIFSSKELTEVGIDKSGNVIYLAEKNSHSSIPKELISAESVTASEAFIYLTKIR